MKEIALTTIDNPYSPFSHYDEWYDYDIEKGYDCCGYIDRMSFGKLDSDSLSDEEENKIIEEIIDDICKTDPTGIYIKVEKVDNKNETSDSNNDFKLSKLYDNEKKED